MDEDKSDQFPPDIWERARRAADLIDPDHILDEDPQFIIAFVLKLERFMGPPPGGEIASNYEGNA